ncbi:MAG: outer membrane lipid asymmetry maintenance protein MlaD [Rhodospirillaceae bacterium]|jgi:phospholipid/cholesterol/gamma-HCH transport system substrate-binding protein|nr:outer membrane lipid asymmetry maintenance protein MlaD [Rhodospirillaceae bacterium]MBT6137960.1 outer membrane lipid asymmetry maintenance protein MlaD [Rhodospirillaceae bacterium]
MRRNMIETMMGAVVVLVAVSFLGFAYSSANIRTTGGYEISANFNKVSGLSVGTDVRMSGIKIGTVVSQTLDKETFLARVTMNIDSDVKLPGDTVASIASEGLLGGTYLELVPGGMPDTLEPGGEIEYTQDPVDIVQLLGKFIFSAKTAADGAKTN